MKRLAQRLIKRFYPSCWQDLDPHPTLERAVKRMIAYYLIGIHRWVQDGGRRAMSIHIARRLLVTVYHYWGERLWVTAPGWYRYLGAWRKDGNPICVIADGPPPMIPVPWLEISITRLQKVEV